MDRTGAASLARRAKKGAALAFALGVVMIVLGILAMGSPFLTGAGVVYTIGFLILAGGIAQTIAAFRADSVASEVLAFLLGVAGVVAGLLMIAHPLFSLGSLILLLAAYFFVHGIFEIALALQVRPARGWGWSLLSGAVTVLFAILVWRGWPLSSSWAIGLLVGTHILLRGWSMIALGAVGRSVAEDLA